MTRYLFGFCCFLLLYQGYASTGNAFVCAADLTASWRVVKPAVATTYSAVCAYFPGTAIVKADSSVAGPWRLMAEIGGNASNGAWTTSGSGKDRTSVNNQTLPGGPFATTSNPTGVFIPEGFSPNNDGVNDRFVVGNVSAGMNVSFEVYNRWGQLVHQENDYKSDWDGKANRGVTGGGRKDLADGAYFYVIRSSDGRNFIKFFDHHTLKHIP